MVGRAGQASAWPGSFVTGISTSARPATLCRVETGGGGSSGYEGSNGHAFPAFYPRAPSRHLQPRHYLHPGGTPCVTSKPSPPPPSPTTM
ncbi:hypothetical protein E8F12_14890 [Pseudomonas sp. BN102]|nr:hypothetical protein [Pseudomonas sp. BN102]